MRARLPTLALGLTLLLSGTGLTLLAGPPGLRPPFPFPWYLLIPLFLAAELLPVSFELRRETHAVSLTQLPLALGGVLVAPGPHLLARLLAAAVYYVGIRRLSPVKALFNLGVAAVEVAVLVLALQTVPPRAAPGFALWAALLVGLLLGDVLGGLAVQAVMRLLGHRRSLAQALRPLRVTLPMSVAFTATAIVGVSAIWTEPWTLLLLAALGCFLALAYRAYRRVVGQQQVTESLYAFVKDLGPLHEGDAETEQVLNQVRELLHAKALDLALSHPPAGWRHLVCSEDDATVQVQAFEGLLDEVARTRTASLGMSRYGGDEDSMATPLVGTIGLLGILTASGRLGSTRGFDMSDLRLLETVASELATALERGRLLEDLHRAATVDALTGLPNLAHCSQQLERLVATCEQGVLVAAVAVESFREVNDTLGHQVGDDLLLEVAVRLRRSHPHAVLGRIGGGRFAVAVSAGDAGGDAALFGLGIRAEVEGGAQVGPVGTHVRLAVGVARAPEHGLDAATLLRRAETAMYSARQAHGGPLLWEPAYEVSGQRRLAVVTALREALATGAIGVAYQPKLATATGQVTGVEALARWTHPALGSIGPDEFVPLAEASGLVAPLTSTVLRQALTACKGWQRRAGRVGVSVNVSADTVLDPTFVTEVAAELAAAGVSPSLLTLELTESIVVADPQLAVERMSELRGLGVKLSIDDFGTGYSSLTYLKGLPIDEVKVDKGFVKGLAQDAGDQAVVRAVVDIAHTMGISVVAEGVEQDDQQAMLHGLGVDEVQGYLHARPMPAIMVANWLRAREQVRN